MKIRGGCHRCILMIALFLCEWIQAQTIRANVYVLVSFSVTAPVIPGDAPATVYENIMGNVELNMDGGNNGSSGRRWQVTVSKSTTHWNTNLQLDVRRDPTRTNVVDGDSYVTIPDAPTSIYFFRSNNTRRVNNLDLQHRFTLNGIDILAGTYTTTVTYTITRY